MNKSYIQFVCGRFSDDGLRLQRGSTSLVTMKVGVLLMLPRLFTRLPMPITMRWAKDVKKNKYFSADAMPDDYIPDWLAKTYLGAD